MSIVQIVQAAEPIQELIRVLQLCIVGETLDSALLFLVLEDL